MQKHNADNERIKHRYFAYLREARGRNDATIDAVAKAIDRFEADTGCRDFKKFRYVQATAFKQRLTDQCNQRTGAKLSKATLHSTLGNLRQFCIWLADQPGYRSRIKYSDAEYFKLSDKDSRIATARRGTKGPTIEQVKLVLSRMPIATDVDRRNRALIAFTLLTGARDLATASMKLKHVYLADDNVFQDPRDVKTKNSKTIRTWFFPVGGDLMEIFADWVTYLRVNLYWGDDDPLFPATRIEVGSTQRFEAAGLNRKHWSTTGPIRAIFRGAFERADLPYFNPHSFRNTLVRFGMKLCRSPEEFKAWSQNLGHEDVMTTFRSYGDIAPARQEELLRNLVENGPAVDDVDAFAEAVVRKLSKMSSSGDFPMLR